MIEIVNGYTYIEDVKKLIEAYYKELDRNLDFQNIDEELNYLQMKYQEPQGKLLVALMNQKVVGCVAFHQFKDEICEMKRLYVLPESRSYHIGQLLVEEIIKEAKQAGYKEMVLDTIEPLKSAIHLYKKYGFKEIEAYYENPMDDVIYMKLDLRREKMKLTMLGTGHAVVTKCYNTCFVLSENHEYFLVDGGGGSTLLTQLERAHIKWQDIKTIFVTHKHLDHITGIFWMVRLITQAMNQNKYEGEVYIYGHDEVIQIIHDVAHMVLQEKETRFIGDRLHLVVIGDGEKKKILNHEVTFFDIHSTKAKQYGFTMQLNDQEKLTCCGDEPYNECNQEYVKESQWLLHEAFCLYSEADIYKPYEKHHSTVKDACLLAEQLKVKNLVLYHSEDQHIHERKRLYSEEGLQYYQGNLFIPDDLESIEI